MKETLLSVGIDLGTSTTQLVFSRLTMENMASACAVPKIEITKREILYKSRIHFTPLRSPTRIDFEKVRFIVEQEYALAGIDKQTIDTGAVIITGETSRKENAEEVLHALSGFAGDFVVATAGPDLESIIAGKGAGTDVYAKEHHLVAANVDIGGGTSNLAVFDHGDIREVGCLDLGGRLIKVDPKTHQITYIAPKIQSMIQKEELPLKSGTIVDEIMLSPIISLMVQALEQSLGLRKDSPYYEDLLTEGRKLHHPEDIQCFSFSGGVADAIYHPDSFLDPFVFGDIGILFGRAIRSSPLIGEKKVIEGTETIRATVVGAGSHTTRLCGSTITYTRDIFPLKNIPVLKLSPKEEEPGILRKAVRQKLDWFRQEGGQSSVAVAFEGQKNPSFQRIREYAMDLMSGLSPIIHENQPLIVILEQDMGKVLGQSLYHLTGYEGAILCLDGIRLSQGEYIDIGKPAAKGQILPVVVKTLVFSQDTSR